MTAVPAQEVITALTAAAVEEAQGIELAASQVDLHRDAALLRCGMSSYVCGRGLRVYVAV